MHLASAGRTGRFGRKGISINFVHDKATWQQMEQIEKQTGKQIIRIETDDLDAMEEVRPILPPDIYSLGGLFARVSSDVLMSPRHHCSK